MPGFGFMIQNGEQLVDADSACDRRALVSDGGKPTGASWSGFVGAGAEASRPPLTQAAFGRDGQCRVPLAAA